jgi:hypothetical protein
MNDKFSRIVPMISKVRLAKAFLVGAALVAGISAGQAWATSGSGTQSTLVGRATFDDPISVRRVGEAKWKVDVKAKPALDVAVQASSSPAARAAGTATRARSSSPSCRGR